MSSGPYKVMFNCFSVLVELYSWCLRTMYASENPWKQKGNWRKHNGRKKVNWRTNVGNQKNGKKKGRESRMGSRERFKNKVIFKMWKEIKMRKIFTKKLKGAREILISCWTVNEGEHEYSILLCSLLQREGRS